MVNLSRGTESGISVCKSRSMLSIKRSMPSESIPSLERAVFTLIAPPGSTDVPLLIGGLTFLLCVVSAVAAWTSRETSRLELRDLEQLDGGPTQPPEFDGMHVEAA